MAKFSFQHNGGDTASLTLRQELGDTEGIAWSLAGLALANVAHDAAHAEAALGQQDTMRAAALFAESFTYYRKLGDEAAIQLVQNCIDRLTRDPSTSTIT